MIDRTAKLKNIKTGAGWMVAEIAEPGQTLSYLGKGELVGLFDGVNITLEYMKKYMAKPRGRQASSEHNWFGGWNEFDTYEAAMETFLHNPQRVTKYNETDIKIKDIHESGNQVEHDVTGDFIDMGRFVEGVPESMGHMQLGNARNRRVSIVIDGNHAASMSSSTINKRTTRILRLVDALEAGGVRTEIKVIWSDRKAHIEITAKRYEDTVVLSDLAVLTHSDFLRRMNFRMIEYSKTHRGGYGSARDFAEKATPDMMLSGSNDEVLIYIDNHMTSMIDERFDQVERLLAWEMSKPIPEMEAIKISNSNIAFSGNNVHDEMELIREGREVMRGA